MTRADEVKERLQAWVDDNPEAVAAGLIALAVERKVLGAREAQRLAAEVGLGDLEAVKMELALRVDDAGRTRELVELMNEGRKVIRRARELLDRHGKQQR